MILFLQWKSFKNQKEIFIIICLHLNIGVLEINFLFSFDYSKWNTRFLLVPIRSTKVRRKKMRIKSEPYNLFLICFQSNYNRNWIINISFGALTP